MAVGVLVMRGLNQEDCDKMSELWAFLTQPLQIGAIWFVFFAYLAFKLGRMLELRAICACFELIPKDYYGEEF